MKNKIINIILIILFISIGITIFLLINNKEDTIDTIDNHEISFNILNSKIEMTNKGYEIKNDTIVNTPNRLICLSV